MEAKFAMVMLEGGIQLMGPMNPAAIDHHHDLFLGFPEGGHDLVQILAKLLRIKVRHDFVEDFGGPILHGANHAEQHAAGDPAPGAILHPRLAFAGLLTFDLTLAQGTYREASALGGAPPTRPRQGKAPEDRFVGIEQNDLAPARPVFEGREVDRAIREVCGIGIKTPGGAVVAYFFFFNTPRTLSRPRWTPVSRANTVASSRQLHWEWSEPCWRGSSSTRRLRCLSSSQVTLGGRPERGRSLRPCVPWCAKRWTHLRRAEYVNWRVSETVWRRCPLTTSRTACARRKTRASFVCFKKVSKVGRASSGKWSLRVRMRGVSTIKYYKNMKIHHSTSCSYPLIGTKFFRLEFPRSCFTTSHASGSSSRAAASHRAASIKLIRSRATC